MIYYVPIRFYRETKQYSDCTLSISTDKELVKQQIEEYTDSLFGYIIIEVDEEEL